MQMVTDELTAIFSSLNAEKAAKRKVTALTNFLELCSQVKVNIRCLKSRGDFGVGWTQAT